MKWLAKHDAVMDCSVKIVTVKKLGDLEFILSRRKEGMVILYYFVNDS